MNIKEDIKKFLDETGWTASRLAQESGVSIPVITRLLSGERKGLHSDTVAKVWPFLHGNLHPKAKERAA